MAASLASQTIVQRAYIAYYGRPADPVGLDYWATKLDEAPSWTSLINAFGTADEATLLYPASMGATTVINNLYLSMFNHAADLSGLLYYAGKLSSGEFTRSDIMLRILDGASGADATAVANKLAAAVLYTAALDTGAEVIAYSGTAANTSARAFVATVDSTAASLTAATAAVDTSVAAMVVAATPVVASQTFTLTTGLDTGTAFTGGAGADSFSGTVIGANATGTTLQAGDVLNGGAGTDTLTISVSGAAAAATTTTAVNAVSLSGIEKVSVNNFNILAMTGGTPSATIDASLFDSSLATLALSASSSTATNGDTSFTNVKNLVAAEMSQGAGSLTVGYVGTVVAGTADAMTLTLTNQTGGTFTSAGIETLNVVSNTSANTVTLAGAQLKTINVSGAVKDTLGTLAATVTKLDASASTGGVVATLNATTTTVTGSTGGDTITAGANLSTGSVNAADGTDTLVLTDDAVIAVAADGAKFTNFETLSRKAVEGVSAARAQDMSLISGITTLNATIQDGTDSTNTANTTSITYSNVAATTNTLNVTALSSVETVIAGAGVELTANVLATRATNTAADAMTVNLGTSTAASGATVIAGTTAVGDILLNLTLANEETITINSLGAGANFVATLDATAMTSLTATGAQAVSFAAFANNTLTTKIDASAMTANFTMGTNAGTTASTITGGSGNDSLVGGTKADVITGNGGNNTIVGAAGEDSLTGGDGNDVFAVATVTHFTTGVETVIGGAGNDTLSIAEAATATTITAANLGAISGIEILSLNSTSAASSVTLTDAVYTANGQALKIVDADLTQGTLTVDASALTGTNAISVTANTVSGATGTDTLTGGAGNDTFTFSTTAGLEATDTVVGGAGTDTIVLTATTAAVTAVMTGVRTVENVTTTGAGFAIGITVTDANIAASTTLTTNASAQNSSTGALTYSGSAVTTSTKVQNVTGTSAGDTIVVGTGADIVSGGSGDDAITGGAGVDNLSGGDGNDTFTVSLSADFVGLATVETVNGGAGNDILSFADVALTVGSADLAGLSSVETLTFANAATNLSVTLADSIYTSNGVTAMTVNAIAATTGTVGVNASSLSAANSITVNADLDGTVLANSSSIVGGAGNDTVKLDAPDLASVSTITGGTGTDTLSINQAGTAVMVAGITGFENITFTEVGSSYTLTTNDANVASGASLNVNASNLTTGVLTFDGSAETNGTFSITGGGGADVLTGGAKINTISGGAGADTITGGLLADVLTGGSGADVFVYTLVTQSNASNTDSITDFASASDKLKITLDYSALVSSAVVDATVQTARAGTTLIQDNLSGARGQAVYDTTGSALYINVNNDNLLTTSDYKIAINPAATATATIAEGDINFVISGGSAADTITAGSGADTIAGGAGGDSITGGAGADVISVTSGASTLIGGAGADSITGGTGVDIVRWTGTTAATFATETGSTAGTSVVFTAGSIGDKVASFTSTTDKLYFAAAGVTNAIGGENDTADVIAAAGTVTNTARFVIVSTNQADLLFATAVTLLDGLTTTAVAIGDSFIAAVDNGTDTALFYVKQVSVSNTIAAQDVTLIGQLTGTAQLATGDFVSF